jgi:hypothetical protein
MNKEMAANTTIKPKLMSKENSAMRKREKWRAYKTEQIMLNTFSGE